MSVSLGFAVEGDVGTTGRHTLECLYPDDVVAFNLYQTDQVKLSHKQFEHAPISNKLNTLY
jgi:hypothetical protein